MATHIIRQVVMQHAQGRRRLFLLVQGQAEPIRMAMPGDGEHYPRAGDTLAVHSNGACSVVPMANAEARADSRE